MPGFDEARNQEYGVDVAYSRGSGYLRYDTDSTQPTGKIANIEAAGEFFFTKNWGVDIVGVRDLLVQTWRQEELGLVYKDDCVRVDVIYEHQNTINGALGASNSVFLRLTLATLGDQRYKNADFR